MNCSGKNLNTSKKLLYTTTNYHNEKMLSRRERQIMRKERATDYGKYKKQSKVRYKDT